MNVPWVNLNTPGGPCSERWPVRVRADHISASRPNPYTSLTTVFLLGGTTIEVFESVIEVEIGIKAALRGEQYFAQRRAA